MGFGGIFRRRKRRPRRQLRATQAEGVVEREGDVPPDFGTAPDSSPFGEQGLEAFAPRPQRTAIEEDSDGEDR